MKGQLTIKRKGVNWEGNDQNRLVHLTWKRKQEKAWDSDAEGNPGTEATHSRRGETLEKRVLRSEEIFRRSTG